MSCVKSNNLEGIPVNPFNPVILSKNPYSTLAAGISAATARSRGVGQDFLGGIDLDCLKLDLLKGKLLAGLLKEAEGQRVGKMSRAELDLDGLTGILRERFGHFSVQNEGSVGVELFLKLEDLLVFFSPRSCLIHGKNEKVAAAIVGKGIKHTRVLKPHWSGTHDIILIGLKESGSGKPLIKHEVNKHTCHRDVKPERKSPTSPSAVAFVAGADGVVNGNQNERHNRDRQDDVGGEHPVVKSAPGSCSSKGSVDTVDENFVEDVGDKENGRDDEGASHTVSVGDFPVRFDAKKASEKEKCRDGVEARIEGRKVGNTH